jgi:hypothetical protein
MEGNLDFNADGMPVPDAEYHPSDPLTQAATTLPDGLKGIDRITVMIADPESPLADITRLIALEIAGVMKKMSGIGDDVLARGVTSQRDLNDQVKAWRDLQKTLTEADALSKKDVLNLDGPKFKFVFGELVRLYRQSLKDAGLQQELSQNIMLQFGDLVKANDEQIRRELSRIESGRKS